MQLVQEVRKILKCSCEVFAKLLSSFLEYEVLFVVTDRYDFEFSIKPIERKRWTEDSTHIQETEIIDNRNIQMGIRTIKPTNFLQTFTGQCQVTP